MWHPIILGISPRTYTDDQLQQMREFSTEPVEIDGRTKTRYQWSQEMRRCETAIRQQKDTATLARYSGDETLRQRCQGTILQLNRHYEELANQAGLKPEFQRTYVAGFSDTKTNTPSGENGPVAAGRRYGEKSDRLYRWLQFVQPIDGYEDFGTHGQRYYLEIDTNNGQTEKYNAKQFADMLRADPEYHGGNIRLLACHTGKEEDGFARQLAKQLGVDVMAPTEEMWISDGDPEISRRPAGDLFLTNIATLAEMWYSGIDVQETGSWRLFHPNGTWVTVGKDGK